MNIRLLPLALLFSLAACEKQPTTDIPSTPRSIASITRPDAFTTVQRGTLPLVISVPHGGTLAPDSLPDRTCPNITTALDTYTLEMVRAIDSVARADYGWQTYLVTNTLRRTKLDQNRPLPEATCGNAAMDKYWYTFHNAVDSCVDEVLKRYPQCLYIDLHAHGHTAQRLELGYLATASDLRNPSTLTVQNTSLKSLGVTGSAASLLTGANSFGTLMQNLGYPSVPSAAAPAPAAGEDYFDGGYNTARYTARSNTYGWQIESNYSGVRENAAQRTAFAKAFLAAVLQWYGANTPMKPEWFGR